MLLATRHLPTPSIFPEVRRNWRHLPICFGRAAVFLVIRCQNTQGISLVERLRYLWSLHPADVRSSCEPFLDKTLKVTQPL